MSDTTPGSSRSEHLRASPPLLPIASLDKLTRVHHLVPVAIYVPAIVVLLVLGVGRTSVLGAVGLFAAGYLMWTLAEYWIHRVVFHFEPEDGWGAKVHFLIHGVHHEHPNDPLRLVMPPLASIPLAIAFALAYRWVFGAEMWLPVTAGFLAGYVIYDELHYLLHHYVPTNPIGRRLRELHMRHHFQDDTRGFGISAPYWDKVFRTNVRSRRH
jgi:sterol desaturase/sphingolipid hydroxylase (fatty acid hydroxylase superfamily)